MKLTVQELVAQLMKLPMSAEVRFRDMTGPLAVDALVADEKVDAEARLMISLAVFGVQPPKATHSLHKEPYSTYVRDPEDEDAFDQIVVLEVAEDREEEKR